MSYTPTTDFLALLRRVSGGGRFLEIPGLDYLVEALARAGLFALHVGQTAPTTDQATTVWLKPFNPSWSAEGTVFLWNASTLAYEAATPALWSAFLAPDSIPEHFQSVTTAGPVVVADGTTLLAVQRDAPAATALTLPSVLNRGGVPLHIVDWSTNVVAHSINPTPDGAETIMRGAAFPLVSTAASLVSVTLYPSINLNGWHT